MLQSVWQIGLLGKFTVRSGTESLARLSTRQPEFLLAILADQAGTSQDRREIIQYMWPDEDFDACRNRLRVALSYLRRAMEPLGTPRGAILRTSGEQLELSADCVEVDSVQFRSLCETANRSEDREEKVANYLAADRLYTGQFLSGWQGEWVETRRFFYSRLQASSQRALSMLLEEAGNPEAALLHIRRAIEAEPLRESLRRRELRLLSELGELRIARESFDAYRSLLKSEVGLAPSETLQAWVETLPRSEKRTSPEHVGEHPGTPATTADAHSNRHLLPLETSSFVGRASELADISELLLVGRFVSLTGPGAIGKTRLAIRVAAANRESFGAGIFYVDVADQMSATTLLNPILRHLKIEGRDDPLMALKRHFSQGILDSGRNACLFVFDGVDNTSGRIEEVLSRLLGAIPNSTVLAISRKRLDFVGEVPYNLGPLSWPEEEASLEVCLASSSVQLFAERAKAVDPRFSIRPSNVRQIVQLCRELEGIPLAIELAASRSRGVPPSRLIDDLGPGSILQGGMPQPRRSALESSLIGSLCFLSETDQTVFRMLCVFTGAFDSSAAMYVAGATAETLNRLVDHCLLSRETVGGEPHYRMLTLVREFGWRQCLSHEREYAAERHAAFFRRLVTDSELLLLSGLMRQSVRLFCDPRNIKQAVDWTVKQGDAETISWFLLRLAWRWAFTNPQEGIDLITGLRERLKLDVISAARVEMAEAILACYQDDAEAAKEGFDRCLPILKAAGITTYSQIGKWILAFVAYLRGDFPGCVAIAKEVQEEFRQQAIPRWNAAACQLIGVSTSELGDSEEAFRWLAQSESLWCEVGEKHMAGYSMLGLARAECRSGCFDEARCNYHRALRTFQECGDSRGVAYSVEGLGRLEISEERFEQGARLLGLAQRLRDDAGLRRDFVDTRDLDTAMSLLKGKFPNWESCWKAGATLSLERVLAQFQEENDRTP